MSNVFVFVFAAKYATNEVEKNKLELPAIRGKSETAKEICVVIVGETTVEPLQTLDGR